MFLKDLKLTNFRNISDFEISFLNSENEVRGLTLLLGENGTGKSGILKGIAMITAGSSALGSILEEPDSWIKNGESFCEVKATLVTKAGEERNLSLRIDQGDHLREIMGRSAETLQEIDDALEHTARNYFVLGYGASRRLSSDRDFGRNKSLRYDNVATIFDPNAILSPLESWAMDLDYQYGSEGINTVKEVLGQFLGDVHFHEIDRKGKRLLFETPYGIVPLSSLSDGYQNVAAWIGDLLYRITTTFDDYKEPLNTRGVLLIDEVDLHLHPKWQRQLLTFLKDKLPNFQIVATTHSPLTAQQADEGELFILTRNEENRIEMTPFGFNPSTLHINQLLSSDLFGLSTTRSVQVEKMMKERDDILSRAKIAKGGKVTSISDEDQIRLNTITKKMESLPTGENPQDIQAMDLIRRMASKLKNQSEA